MQCDNATEPHTQTAAPPAAAATAAAPVDYEARYRAQRAAAAAQVTTRYWKRLTICHSERRVSGHGGAGRAAVRPLPLTTAGQARLRRAGGDGAIISLSSHHAVLSSHHAVLSSYLASVSHHVIHAAHQLVGMPSHHAVYM